MTISGGFLGVPRSSRVDAAALSAAARAELQERVDALGRAATPRPAGRQGSEVEQYDIAVRTDSGTQTYRAWEGGEAPAFAALRAWIAAHRK